MINLAKLVDEAAGGAEITIARAGKPVARLVPLAAPGRKPRGARQPEGQDHLSR